MLVAATRDWESVLRSWKAPSSETEQQRSENAERMIKDAIRESTKLRALDIDVFAQGSYKNNTNVRFDSDVDVCVSYRGTIFTELPAGTQIGDVGLTPATYQFAEFRNDVEAALVAKFGRRGVTRGNKAFDIHENNYRVDADVVAAFEHRRYMKTPGGLYTFVDPPGTEFQADDGTRVVNWPRQHHRNGVEKNKNTNNRFKFLTRCLKRLRNEMADRGIAAAQPIPSYLIECLVWNVPDLELVTSDSYVATMQRVLAHTFNNTRNDDDCSEWGEVSELKYLFRSGQPWNRVDANRFIDAAWAYLGFK